MTFSQKSKLPTCPICGKEAKKIHTVYGPRYECCGLWSWDGAPLVSKEVHDLRKQVHLKFDPLWQTGKMTRTQAYKYLAWKLEIPFRKCHMKLMEKRQLKKVLKILEKGKEKENENN